MQRSLQLDSDPSARVTRRRGIVVLGVLAIAGTLAWTFDCSDCAAGRNVDAPAPSSVGTQPRSGSPTLAALPIPVADHETTLRSVAAIESALFSKGSLQGTQAPHWGVERDQRLTPSRALRDRFDYYLLALSEASLAELTLLVQTHARRDLGDATAAEVMSVWERYLKLQQYPYKVAAKLGDPMSMQAALQEHQQARQGLLGVHWATSFYGDEEKQLMADIDSAQHGAPSKRDADARLMTNPAPGTDLAALHQQRAERFGPAAAQRLAQLDGEHAAWDLRIDTARVKVKSLTDSAELSESQRAAAIQQWLDHEFPDPVERLRAGGLVGD